MAFFGKEDAMAVGETTLNRKGKVLSAPGKDGFALQE
jgi:hypothetical protein